MSVSGQRHTGGRTGQAAHVSRVIKTLGWTPHPNRNREGIRVRMRVDGAVSILFDFDTPDPDRPWHMVNILRALGLSGYTIESVHADKNDARAVVRKEKA